MSSPTFSRKPLSGRRWVAALPLIAMLALVGCASGPETTKTQESAGVTVDENGVPVDTRVAPPAVQTLYERAVASMAAGDTIDAELRFQEFLLQYPDYPGAHVNLAIIFAGRDDFQAAENSLTDALIIDPRHPVALNQLGMLQRQQGKFQEAETAYVKALEADPNYALAHYNLGILNDLYLQRLEIALQHYEQYQALVGEDPQVARWITDLNRRISAAQRTANVTE